jgi:hypothetical protein
VPGAGVDTGCAVRQPELLQRTARPAAPAGNTKRARKLHAPYTEAETLHDFVASVRRYQDSTLERTPTAKITRGYRKFPCTPTRVPKAPGSITTRRLSIPNNIYHGLRSVKVTPGIVF